MDDSGCTAEKGVLYVVATPIGHLGDMTFRAVGILKTVDVIAAEDTRNTARLLSHYDIHTRLISCHEHNESERARQIVEQLAAGQSAALVSDAGTPGLSDPGYRIACAAIREGFRVAPVPGACAAVAALSAAALPSDRFLFAGFPPKKGGPLRAMLEDLAGRKETLVFYESPHRIVSLLESIRNHMGDRTVVLARELTKLYEEFIRGSAGEVEAALRKKEKIRGEITLLVSGKPDEKPEIPDPEMLEAEILGLLPDNPSTARLAAMLAKRYNCSKNDMYQAILAVKSRMET